LFDAESAAFLRDAPAVDGLPPNDLPEIFTETYARLVAARVRGEDPYSFHPNEDWPLARIADVYELIATTAQIRETFAPAAFVAATAQQLISQMRAPEEDLNGWVGGVTRDWLDPQVAAALLFLIARQFADAADAATKIRVPTSTEHPNQHRLLLALKMLCRGEISSLAEVVPMQNDPTSGIDDRAEQALQGAILDATVRIAEVLLGRDGGDPRDLLLRVISACGSESRLGGQRVSRFPGYQQLAQLLMTAYDAFEESALVRVPPPPGTDPAFWSRWTRSRAMSAPFVWPNHMDPVRSGFHHPGTSATLVLPTGAGKTTLASMKIASVVGSGARVIVLAPTHALVDQLDRDLRRIFPRSIWQTNEYENPISVMTPEHCLALLSFDPDTYQSVALIVFDEAHLLSAESGTRRSIDAMLAVLMLTRRTPNADLLFLSAMLQNGAELADWIGSITNRRSVFFEPLWKPSRQARGVVMYRDSELQAASAQALVAQIEADRAAGKKASSVRSLARDKLRLTPFGLFGLEQNWLDSEHRKANVTIQKLLDHSVNFEGKIQSGRIAVMPTVNRVAGELARAAADGGLKCIIFANVKSHTMSIARDLRTHIAITERGDDPDRSLWEDLALELGGLEHSLNAPGDVVVCHNSLMLRTERTLAERSFQRKHGGARVIVATPTLAQGMNLPADVAILASEMRASVDRGRESLAAHELMNAAARAGRAGHVANGLVILVSEAVLTFSEHEPLSGDLVKRLKAILPIDDRSIELVDPLQRVLDLISTGQTADPDADYVMNRLSMESETMSHHSVGFADRSFANFQAKRAGISEQFRQQVQQMQSLVEQRSGGLSSGDPLLVTAAQTGLPTRTIAALADRLGATSVLPTSVVAWVEWTFSWLKADDAARPELFGRETGALAQSVGKPSSHDLNGDDLDTLRSGLVAWLTGASLREIELALGGSVLGNQRTCFRARNLVTKAIPLPITFAISVVALVARWATPGLTSSERLTLDSLVAAVREGFDSPALVAFAKVQGRGNLRVRKHLDFAADPALRGLETSASTLDGLVQIVRTHLLSINPQH